MVGCFLCFEKAKNNRKLKITARRNTFLLNLNCQ
jgi:hypothetical protein